MPRIAALTTCVIVLVACADDDVPPLEPTPLAEVCGAAGPFHLLPLAADERLGVNDRSFAVLGERLLFIAGTGQDFVSPALGPIPTATTVHAVGPCGEDPIVVARDIEAVFVDPHWPDLALGCTLGARDLVRLDLSGAEDPVLLAPDACSATITDHGLLHYTQTKDGLTSAEFFPLVDADAPWFGAPVLVAPPVRVVNSLDSSVALRPTEVLLVEASGDLVSVALPELTRTVLQAGVVTFASSDDSRYLLYQRSPSSGDDPYNPIGDISILDRDRGVSVPVGTGRLNGCGPCFLAPGFARVDLTEPSEHQRLITLPDLQYIDVPKHHELFAPLDDGRWLTHSEHYDTWSLVDLATGTSKVLSNKRASHQGHSDDHLDIFIGPAQTPQSTPPLVRIFFDDRPARTLLAAASPSTTTRDDGRLLGNADVDAAWIGALILTDPETLTTTRIDDHVIAGTNFERWQHPDIPDTLLYGVLDGPRTGVWLARLAPPE